MRRRVPLVTALAAVATVAASALVSDAAGRVAVERTPNGPIYAGLPGALPPTFAYSYNDGFVGWPLRPGRVQRPMRGSFLDPRGADNDALGGYHFGLDINVDDRKPEPGAPPGLSHRVYAVESGVVSAPANVLNRTCGNRRVEAGHFSYWHTSPIVRPGQRVRAGQQIGWTCIGEWHVHLSEWQQYRGVRVWVNPLHRGGKLTPYRDATAPRVRELHFHSPPARPWIPTVDLTQRDSSRDIPATALRGPVEVRVLVSDPAAFAGFLAERPAWVAGYHPYRLSIAIRDSRGRTVLRRTSFRADQLPQTPYFVHYAPGTSQNSTLTECIGPPPAPDCSGLYWFRPLSRFRQEFWDTRRGANGRYTVVVRAEDISGNAGEARETVVVAN